MSTNGELRQWLNFVEAHPHEFTIQYPPRREYFLENFRQPSARPVREWLADVDSLLVYLHVPFCEAKCYYCNFAVDVSAEPRLHREYVDALLGELDSHSGWLKGKQVLGIDLGGGTPTRLAVGEVKRILDGIHPLIATSPHPFPLSVETTPRIAAAEPEKLAALRAGGVTRVSMGVQSFNARTLASVNRRRQIEQTERAMANLRACGFNRVNIDVIFGLPEQSVADWQQDLEHLIALRPDSITTYACLYRGKGRVLGTKTGTLPTPEAYGGMYDLAHATLTAAGWHAPYGSVNFSLRNNETGTSSYFEGRLLDGFPYLGLGNYASSWRGNLWSFNTYNARDYVSRVGAKTNPVEFFYELPLAESQAKYVLGSLNYGLVDEKRFLRRFGVPFADGYSEELEFALRKGLLEHSAGQWRIAPGQFRHMHAVRSLFYPATARQWLQNLYGNPGGEREH